MLIYTILTHMFMHTHTHTHEHKHTYTTHTQHKHTHIHTHTQIYTEQVDIFSFGMFIYELITLHLPYEVLTAQQANQANESGARPTLTKKVCQ